MYLLIVILLMLVFPVASILVEALLLKSPAAVLFLVGKWFVFWAVGVRQLLAGVRQVIRPQFTTEGIFGIKSSEPWPIVRELGFANLSMGALGVLSLADGRLVAPSAIVSGLFFGIAGINHLVRKERNFNENVATLSDLFLFFVLLAYATMTMVKG